MRVLQNTLPHSRFGRAIRWWEILTWHVPLSDIGPLDGLDPEIHCLLTVIRVADMPRVANACDPPEEWFLDAARCRDCEIEQLTPATNGYDEALCLLAVNETDGIQSVDASTLAVVDLSPTGNGYAPPVTEVFPLIAADDPGYLRWLRMKAHLAEIDTTAPPRAGDLLRDALSDATDIPPGIDV